MCRIDSDVSTDNHHRRNGSTAWWEGFKAWKKTSCQMCDDLLGFLREGVKDRINTQPHRHQIKKFLSSIDIVRLSCIYKSIYFSLYTFYSVRQCARSECSKVNHDLYMCFFLFVWIIDVSSFCAMISKTKNHSIHTTSSFPLSSLRTKSSITAHSKLFFCYSTPLNYGIITVLSMHQIKVCVTRLLILK